MDPSDASRRAQLSWLLAVVAAAVVVGFVPCSTNPMLVVAALGFVPGAAEALAIRLNAKTINPFGWLAATVVGSFVALGFAYLSILLAGLAIGSLLNLLNYDISRRWPGAADVAALSLGGVVAGLCVGALQSLALPATARWRWITASGIGGLAIAPLAAGLLAVLPCGSVASLPLPLFAGLAGLLFALVTSLPFGQVVRGGRSPDLRLSSRSGT